MHTPHLYNRLTVILTLCMTVSLHAQPINPNFKFDKLSVTSTGSLDIKPSATSSAADFDYLVGNWKLDDKKLKSRLTNSTEWISFESTVEMKKLLNGRGNMDIYRTTVDGKPFEGIAIRLFNPTTRLWSIYWIDSNSVVLENPVIGSFDGNIGKFYCEDKYKGIDIIVLFLWDKTDPNNPVWSQAFSPDNGVTWEWNATNVSHRVR